MFMNFVYGLCFRYGLKLVKVKDIEYVPLSINIIYIFTFIYSIHPTITLPVIQTKKKYKNKLSSTSQFFISLLSSIFPPHKVQFCKIRFYEEI